MTTGEKIKMYRKALGLTQTELGRKLGVQKNAVSKWECGRVYDIPASKIKAMASLFNIPTSLLIDEDQEMLQIKCDNVKSPKRVSDFANRLKQYRDGHKYTLSDVEQLTGTPAQTLNRYELGQRKPKVDTAIDIAEKLKINPLWLQGYDVDMYEEPATIFDDGFQEIAQLFSELPPTQREQVLDYMQYLADRSTTDE